MDIQLFGFDPQNGDLRWTFNPPYRIQELSPPSSDGQTVYAATAAGRVYAIDGATGSVRWQTIVVDSPAVAYNPKRSGNNVYGGFTVFASSGSAQLDSGGVFSLDASTGAIRWIFYFPRPNPATAPRGWIRPVVSGSLVVAATEGGGLYALDRSSGQLVWKDLPPDLAGFGNGALAAWEQRVFIGFNNGTVAALDGATGREHWRLRDIPYTVRRMIAEEGVVYVTFAGTFAAVDAGTGKIIWRAGGSGAPEIGVLAAAVDYNRVYLAGPLGFYSVQKNQ